MADEAIPRPVKKRAEELCMTILRCDEVAHGSHLIAQVIMTERERAANALSSLQSKVEELEREKADILADVALFNHHRKKQGDYDTKLIEDFRSRALAAERSLEQLRSNQRRKH